MFEQRFSRKLENTNYRNLTSDKEIDDVAPLVQTEFPKFVVVRGGAGELKTAAGESRKLAAQEAQDGGGGESRERGVGTASSWNESSWNWFIHRGVHVGAGKVGKGVLPDSFAEGYEANGPLIWFRDEASSPTPSLPKKRQPKKAIVLFHGNHFKHGVLKLEMVPVEEHDGFLRQESANYRRGGAPRTFSLGLAGELLQIPAATTYRAVLLPVPNAGVGEALAAYDWLTNDGVGDASFDWPLGGQSTSSTVFEFWESKPKNHEQHRHGV